ncbi:hypothetical protein AALP_AA1G314600 [Arabis alpina]|uniref:Uncharacterized protein n=1 Tax=Arabis alpina TaxID=50452 RepID=A0A087HRX6_ARAAL|nr:hypothetical protein AALP_AA1G314600 [Arabis alpina]
MASSTYSTLALTLLLIIHLTPETTASRHLHENNPAVQGVTTTSTNPPVPSIYHPLPFAPAPLTQGYILPRLPVPWYPDPYRDNPHIPFFKPTPP